MMMITSPGCEKSQRMTAQTSRMKGITWTALSANLTRALSLLAKSAMGSYVGKPLPSNME